MKMVPISQSFFKLHAYKTSVVFLFIIFAGTLISFSLFKGKPKQNSERSRIFENIESIMFLDPENLDSLVNLIDTTNLSLFEQGRLSSIRGKMYRDKKEYIKSIAALEKADSIFLVYKDPFHQNINKFIKATVFEFMQLNSAAAELFVESNLFFDQNQNDKFKFYSSLGIIRMKYVLKINADEIISDLKKDIRNFNNPLFSGLLYSTLGNINGYDTLSLHYFTLAVAEFKKVQAWSRVYDCEINILNNKIKANSSQNTQKDYYAFPNKDYQYIPNKEQNLKYQLGEGHLFAMQREYFKGIKVTNEVLIKARNLSLISSEVNCLDLLGYLYMQVGDYRNANIMLVQYNTIRKKEMDSLEQIRLLALGSHYRFTKLESDRQRLASRMRINLLVFGLISLTLAFLLLINWNRISQGKMREEILKLNNIEIKDQIVKLHRSLERSDVKNKELISLVEELEAKYNDAIEIAAFSHNIDNKTIKSWLEFEKFISDKHPGLIEALQEKRPDLSPIEIKYCLCIYFNLTNYDISQVLNVGAEAVKSAKKRIRNKFALNTSREIYFLLKSLAK